MGAYLSQRRAELGLSQTAVARLAKLAKATINRYEKSERLPTHSACWRLYSSLLFDPRDAGQYEWIKHRPSWVKAGYSPTDLRKRKGRPIEMGGLALTAWKLRKEGKRYPQIHKEICRIMEEAGQEPFTDPAYSTAYSTARRLAKIGRAAEAQINSWFDITTP